MEHIVPSSLTHCRVACERFLRNSLSSIRNIQHQIPKMPGYVALKDTRINRSKFVERAQPNWWQVPKVVRQEIFDSDAGQLFLGSIAATNPFSNTIGKSLMLAGVGRGNTSCSAGQIAWEITTSYLFAAGAKRWKPHKFDLIWRQCVDYFDAGKSHVTCHLYAPLWGFGGVSRSLLLGDGLAVRRLSSHCMAEIGSLDPALAGVTVSHRLTSWTPYFLFKEFQFEKHIGHREFITNGLSTVWACTAWLNDEASLLRALLSHEICIPTYALIYDGYPRHGNSVWTDLPWRPRRPFAETIPTRQQVTRYANARARFKSLSAAPGWAAVAASIRRFSIAWENPFPADSLTDIIAALEGLLVREHNEVGYKLRVRAGSILSRSPAERQKVIDDIRDGYRYRSRVAHGDFVFDDPREWPTAKAMQRAKGKAGNPFHDVNEIHRLRYTLAAYYKAALTIMVRDGILEIDWSKRGL